MAEQECAEVRAVLPELAEVWRGALAAVPGGQAEGAASLGLTRWQSFRLVVWPQALRIALPPTVGTVTGAVKDTSLVLVIGVYLLPVFYLPAAVPVHLREAKLPGARSRLGEGVGYEYPHDYEGHFVRQHYLPPDFKDEALYVPGDLGFEREIGRRLREWWKGGRSACCAAPGTCRRRCR